MRREPDAPRSARRTNFSRKPSDGSSAVVDGQPLDDADGCTHPPGGLSQAEPAESLGGTLPAFKARREL